MEKLTKNFPFGSGDRGGLDIHREGVVKDMVSRSKFHFLSGVGGGERKGVEGLRVGGGTGESWGTIGVNIGLAKSLFFLTALEKIRAIGASLTSWLTPNGLHGDPWGGGGGGGENWVQAFAAKDIPPRGTPTPNGISHKISTTGFTVLRGPEGHRGKERGH